MVMVMVRTPGERRGLWPDKVSKQFSTKLKTIGLSVQFVPPRLAATTASTIFFQFRPEADITSRRVESSTWRLDRRSGTMTR